MEEKLYGQKKSTSQRLVNGSDLYLKYKDAVDSRSAYENLEEVRKEREEAKLEKERKKKFALVNKVANSALSQVGREVSRKIIRGIFGNFKW